MPSLHCVKRHNGGSNGKKLNGLCCVETTQSCLNKFSDSHCLNHTNMHVIINIISQVQFISCWKSQIVWSLTFILLNSINGGTRYIIAYTDHKCTIITTVNTKIIVCFEADNTGQHTQLKSHYVAGLFQGHRYADKKHHVRSSCTLTYVFQNIENSDRKHIYVYVCSSVTNTAQNITEYAPESPRER